MDISEFEKNDMLIEYWKYRDSLYHEVEYDKHYYNYKLIDLGWDEYGFKVHNWVNSLNSISSKIYKCFNKGVNGIKMNQVTANLLLLIHTPYYDDGKLGHYSIEISNDIKDNEIAICIDNNIKGKILIN